MGVKEFYKIFLAENDRLPRKLKKSYKKTWMAFHEFKISSKSFHELNFGINLVLKSGTINTSDLKTEIHHKKMIQFHP